MKRIAIMAMAVLLCATACEQKKELGIDLTVVTSNVRYDNEDDGPNRWNNRKDALVAEILSVDPDIIGTQECLYHQRKYMQEELKGYETVGVAREDGKEKGEYSAIFYKADRFTAIECGNFWLSETPDVPSLGWDAACVRIASWAFLEEKATGKRFFFVNTHLDHVGMVARREGVNLLCKKAKEIGGDCPMVITGDFNAEKESADIQYVKSCGLIHTFDIAAQKKYEVASFHGFEGMEGIAKHIPEAMRPAIIDYIFISQGTCSYYEIMPAKSPDGRFVSDHCPVYAKVRL
ncbi:MAG: endonuclease/exonuclease/phosphatase family protein [Bacteroidales bacterium]|nr:endonuclease/exonuclease/phosphatase family protein [Bacteroidales bacterium]